MHEEVIKDIQMKEGIIEVKMKRIKDIHEYHLQRIQHDERCISAVHDKRSKSKLLYDVSQSQSLKDYLCMQMLDETSFLNLLISIFETVLGLNADKIVCCDIRYIHIQKENGKVKVLCIPVDKMEWNMKETDMTQLVQDIIQYAQVEAGYEIFGCMIQQLKRQPFHLISLLQELTQRLPEEEPKHFFEKWFRKDEEEKLPYPLPILHAYRISNEIEMKQDIQSISKNTKRNLYVEDIEEDNDQATVVLFHKETKDGYLCDKNESMISIAETPFIIGRQKSCDYVILSPTVSKRHASIIKEEDGYYLIDLDSSNHTTLNGINLTPKKSYRLMDQDEIMIADEQISFHE